MRRTETPPERSSFDVVVVDEIDLRVIAAGGLITLEVPLLLKS